MKVGPVLVYHPDEANAYAGLVQAPGDVPIDVAGTPAEAVPLIGRAEILYAWGLPADLLARAPRLRWVQVMGAGVDRFLVPELAPQVVVTRAPVFGDWMVEYVLGWCLWITQRIETYRRAQAERRWLTVVPERLHGKTLVVVGLGQIGQALARAAARLGLHVVGVSRRGRSVPNVARVVRPRHVARALADADFAVIAVPLTEATRGLIGAPELCAMRPHAWLINLARGPIVDANALLGALRATTIAGAILDVFATEPLPPDHPLWDLPNVVITPHISGPSTPAEITPIFNANLRRYRTGGRLRYVVDRRRGY